MCLEWGQEEGIVLKDEERDGGRGELLRDHACQAKKSEFILQAMGSFFCQDQTYIPVKMSLAYVIRGLEMKK